MFRPFISTDEQCNNKNNNNNNNNNKSVGFLLRTSHVLLPLSPILPYNYSLRRWLRYQESVSQWYSLLLFQCFLLSFLLTYLYYISIAHGTNFYLLILICKPTAPVVYYSLFFLYWPISKSVTTHDSYGTSESFKSENGFTILYNTTREAVCAQ